MANKRLREEMYDTARGLHDLGLVGGETLREFDVSRLPALKPYGAADIKRLRPKSKKSVNPYLPLVSIPAYQRCRNGKSATTNRVGRH